MARTRILIADDHPQVLQAVRDLLGVEHDIVAAVENGKELVDSAAQLRPDVIIDDVHMPVMNGFEAAEQMHRLGLTAKLVFLTMAAEPPYLRKARSLGATAYVLKIDDFEHLPKVIEAVLANQTYVSPRLQSSGWDLDPIIH